MYKYLETFLGESTKAMWESYKITFPKDFEALLRAGSNPYNFVNKVQNIATGEDPNSGEVGIC